MEVWEKINYILKEKKITKRQFIERFLNLEPKLKRTSEVPSASTVSGYLYGKREIKIELIPYIAEALDVSEQELFVNDIEYTNDYNYKHSKEAREILNLLRFAPRSAIDDIKSYLLKFKNICEKGIK